MSILLLIVRNIISEHKHNEALFLARYMNVGIVLTVDDWKNGVTHANGHQTIKMPRTPQWSYITSFSFNSLVRRVYVIDIISFCATHECCIWYENSLFCIVIRILHIIMKIVCTVHGILTINVNYILFSSRFTVRTLTHHCSVKHK